jgi:twitching motility protein PilT
LQMDTNDSSLNPIDRAIMGARKSLGTSDVHISPNTPPFARKNGTITRLGEHEITSNDIRGWLTIADRQKNATALSSGSARFVADSEETGPIRVTILKSITGEELAIRLLPGEPPSLDSLNLPEEAHRVLSTKRGLTVISGPVNSGKSTFLAGIARELGERSPNLVYIIEDTSEYKYENKNSLYRQHTVGAHGEFKTYEDALVAMKSGDGDIIICSEALTPSAFHACLDLAEAGFNVLTTLHVESATQLPDRIIGAFPADRQPQVRTMLASVLQNVIVMRLLPLLNGDGRIPVCEVMYRAPGLAEAITSPKETSIEAALFQLIDNNKNKGMCFLEDQLVALCKTKKIDPKVAREFSARPEKFDAKIGIARSGDTPGGFSV